MATEEPPLDQSVPDRIYLIDAGDGEIMWCEDPDPDGDNDVAVEYARVGVWHRAGVAEEKSDD